MDWNNILLIALVIAMLVCCGSMMRMALQKGERGDQDQDEHPQ